MRGATQLGGRFPGGVSCVANLHEAAVELRCNLRRRFEGRLVSLSPQGVSIALGNDLASRSDLISAPEELRVLMALVAERAMDGSDPLCEEIAGLTAARRAMRQ
jgi:hypothetical protein